MKKTRLAIIFLLAITYTFSYCKKSSEIQGSLIGKWKVDSVQLKTVVNYQIIYHTIYKPVSDYYKFSNDSLYVYWMSIYYPPIYYKTLSINGQSVIQYTT
ncbi:MAG: hypothetical protein Q8941_23065, partial [Bacteroidota bacterium]|nr:hypothetical protein [Bacteroidota bacterium]